MDVYRKQLKHDHTLLEVALYIAFFPQILAGPIVRASSFIPQIQKTKLFNKTNISAGIKIFLIGFCYKAVLADNLSYISEPVFLNPAHYNFVSLWIGAFAYYCQIYFDFAGYSSMAIGVAYFFGYSLPKNFNFPYTATNITDFWRRWHISLSSWLRDYLYIPLGGNRDSEFFFYRNLMITMLLGGLWHGASYNFIIWGGMHGVALCFHKAYLKYFIKDNRNDYRFVWKIISFIFTQGWVLIAWIFFRSASLNDSFVFIKGLFNFSIKPSEENISYALFFVLLIPIVVDSLCGKYLKGYIALKDYQYAVLIGFVFSIILWLQPVANKAFIYFQF